MSFFVGVYATLAKGIEASEQDLVYEALRSHPHVRGFEIPFADPWTDAELAQLAARIGNESEVVLTTIPGLFRRGVEHSGFGPASLDEDGRRGAVDFLRQAWEAHSRLGEIIGPERIRAVSVASSPQRSSWSGTGGGTRLAESLTEVLSWGWSGSRVIVEHCDALTPGRQAAKGYLSLQEEILAVGRVNADAGVGAMVGVNWGRSAIEGRGASMVRDHLHAAIEAGLLGELMFSGCSAEPTVYGEAWSDSHPPSANEEAASLLTADSVEECFGAIAAFDRPVLTGLKVSAPANASAEDRIGLLDRELRMLATGARVWTP